MYIFLKFLIKNIQSIQYKQINTFFNVDIENLKAWTFQFYQNVEVIGYKFMIMYVRVHCDVYYCFYV